MKLSHLVVLCMVVGVVGCGDEQLPPACEDCTSEVEGTACRVDTCTPPDDPNEPEPPAIAVGMAVTLERYADRPNSTRWCTLSYTLPEQSEVFLFEGFVSPGEVKQGARKLVLDAPATVILSGGCMNAQGGWDRQSTAHWVESSRTCTYYHYPEGAVLEHCTAR